MGLKKRFGLPGYNELAERRSMEIDEVLGAVLASPPQETPPIRIGNTFGSVFIAYMGLASRDEPRTIVLGDRVYDNAEKQGLLSWVKLRFPQLTVERASARARGPHPSLCIVDEVVDWNTNPIAYRLPE